MSCSGNGRALITLAAAVLLVTSTGLEAQAVDTKGKRSSPQSGAQQTAEADVAAWAELPEVAKAERALAREPGDRAARIQAAKAHLAADPENPSRVEAAQRHALVVLAEHPADLEALLLAGQTSLLLRDAAGAARYYRAVTVADGGNATAFLGLGDALTRLGDDPGATAAFARYRELMGMPPLPPAGGAN